MAGFNRVILLGNLTANPELRYTPQGTAVCDLRLAVNTTRGRAENRRDETLYIDATAWGRQAEVICEYMEKGRPIMIEGRLSLDTWEDRQSGQKRSKIRAVVENFQFLGGGSGTSGRSSGRSSSRKYNSGPRDSNRSDSSSRSGPPSDSFDDDFGSGDDIPF